MTAKYVKFLSPVLMFATPLLASAQSGPTLEGLLRYFDQLLRLLIPTLMVIATILFLWGVIRYVTAGADEEKLKQGRNLMLFGIVALFVMVAVWGLVDVLIESLNIDPQDIPEGPGGEPDIFDGNYNN